jgi:hypothetical protein
VSRCIGEAFEKLGFLGCYSNITDLINQRCAGKSRCEIEGDDPSVLLTKDCGVGLPLYMDISYTCVSGEF